MDEEALGEEVVRLQDAVQVRQVDARGHAHQYVLRQLGGLPVQRDARRSYRTSFWSSLTRPQGTRSAVPPLRGRRLISSSDPMVYA